VYVVSAGLLYAACTVSAVNTEFSIALNDAFAYHIAQTTSLIQRPTGFLTQIIRMAIGDTFRLQTYHNQGGPVALSSEAWSNTINIRELPHTLTRV